MSESEIRSAENTLKAGTWAITAGALLFSVLTVTPLVRSVTPAGWGWTAPILPVVVDAAVIIVVQLDSVISRLGGNSGFWPALLRWMTGVMTLALNIGNSALHRDWVGVAVHAVAPLLLIVTAEAGLAYRRAINAALTRIAQQQEEEQARERAEHAAEQARQRAETERAQAAREEAERAAREHARQVELERAEREEKRLREEREHALAVEKERTAREAAERQSRIEQENAEREHQARLDRERAEREAAERRRQEERADRERREQTEREERARQEEIRRQEKQRLEQPKVTVPAPARRVSPKAVKQTPRVVQSVVLSDEFTGMTRDAAELALFKLYRDARDASPYEDWEQDPQARPGGDFCGSNLGRRLGRGDGSGRANVKPKFERWYAEYRAAKDASQEKELVGAR
ncbi:DUF2637 domain-containing protein [Streptomyces microflavus]|uniref:DUF2637 domain-containing protein n=1 Tax=Streptomyces microflavus TaxID=1919 RepID=UPI00341157FC